MDLAFRDLVRRHQATGGADADVNARLLAALLRQTGASTDKQLMAVPYRRYGPGGMNTTGYFNKSIEGMGDGYAYWFPHTEGMTKEQMGRALTDFREDDFWIGGDPENPHFLHGAEGIAVCSNELYQILISSKNMIGGDSQSDVATNHLVGIAYAQAIKIIKMKDLEEPGAADDPEGFVQAMQQYETAQHNNTPKSEE